MLIEMSGMMAGRGVIPAAARTWIELALATPVVLWAGWPLLVRGWESILNRSLNMFTLIGIGVGVAYGYSLFAAIFPNLFPDSFRAPTAPCRFTSRRPPLSQRWCCSGRCSNLRARSHTSSAIKALLGLGAEDGARDRPRRPRGRRPARPRASRAIGCACGRARKCRLTAWWSRARARSTNRW